MTERKIPGCKIISEPFPGHKGMISYIMDIWRFGSGLPSVFSIFYYSCAFKMCFLSTVLMLHVRWNLFRLHFVTSVGLSCVSCCIFKVLYGLPWVLTNDISFSIFLLSFLTSGSLTHYFFWRFSLFLSHASLHVATETSDKLQIRFHYDI